MTLSIVSILSWQSRQDPPNLIQASQNLILPFDPSHNAKEHCMTRQNQKNTRHSSESSLETWKPSLEFQVYIPHSKGFRDLFRQKHNNNHSHIQQTHWPTAPACTV